tara:strand:- start:3852 stop:5801 length:1950 start_codon:yes stop_codon:yes gene_type:complete
MGKSPKQQIEQHRTLTRRALVVGGVQAAILTGIGAQMARMQLRDADQYRMLAEENRISLQLIGPTRGRILDRSGQVIADSTPSYQITIVPERAGDLEAMLRKLQQVLKLDDETIAAVLEKSETTSSFVPLTVADNVTWDDIAVVSLNAPALPGVDTEMVRRRAYQFGPDFAHVIGYVGRVSPKDMEEAAGEAPVLSLPGFQIGKLSIEKRFERELRGEPGTKAMEVNASGRIIRDLYQDAAKDGRDIQLTIDHHLQNFALARLNGQSAAAIVMDVKNGDLLAAASAPSFDPNLFVSGISSADYSVLRESEFRPLSDKTVQGAYPPGSTLKMSLAMSTLQDKKVTPEETVYCPGYVEIAGRRFHCWKRAGHGNINLRGAIRESCDVFFYEMAQRVGIDNMNAMNSRFGIGERPDLPLAGIVAGLNPSREWKKSQEHGGEWLIGDTINASIGQGYVLASPMQLTTMVARVATGKMVQPRLVRDKNPASNSDVAFESMGLDPTDLGRVQEGMFEVVNSSRGTARSSRIVDPTQIMAGKTGTSQVFSITAAERASGVRSQAELPWNRRDHALFTAYAPYDNPQIAVSVVVEHGGGGSTAAAPVARDLVLFHLNKGLPPLTAYPENQRSRMATDLAEIKERIIPSDTENGPSPT